MRRALFLSISLVVLAAAFLTAQVGTRPAQSAGQPAQTPQQDPPKATAMIVGQVIDGTNGQPVADAIVTLTSSGGRGRGPSPTAANIAAATGVQAQQAQAAAAIAAAALAGRGGQGPDRVMTGADGRFVFYGLLPGNYSVSASLTGYTPSLGVGAGTGLSAFFAAASGGGTSLTLKEGEFATALKLRLWKHAVVSGVVVDDAGEPAIGINVRVARRVMMAGRARYVPGTQTRTDDRGAYRINGLVPGNYVVFVPQTSVSIPTAIMSSMMDSITGNGPPGGGLAMLDVLSAGVDISFMQTGGLRVGDYIVAASGLLPILSPDGRLQVFQTTFFPGAGSPVQATLLSLGSGDERTDVGFQLRLIPTSRVSGTAIGPDGPVANVGVRLVVPGDGLVSESEYDVATALTRADGSFTFYGVPPGEFILRASKQPRPEMPAEVLANPMLGQMFGGASTGKPQTEVLFASATVTVSGNVDGVALQLAPGFHVAGKVEFESRTPRPVPTGQQLQSISVNLTSIDGRSAGGGLFGAFGGQPDRVTQQGEFKTKGFQAGKYFLAVSTGGWLVKSATIGGRDVLDVPFELNTDMTGLVVTLTDQMATVSGTVSTPGETDASETTVILFPSAYKTWITNGMTSRLVRTTRANRAGAYTLANIPAGEYLVAAIDRSAEDDMQDPAVIEALSRIAARVTVTADPAHLDLTKARVGK